MEPGSGGELDELKKIINNFIEQSKIYRKWE